MTQGVERSRARIRAFGLLGAGGLLVGASLMAGEMLTFAASGWESEWQLIGAVATENVTAVLIISTGGA